MSRLVREVTLLQGLKTVHHTGLLSTFRVNPDASSDDQFVVAYLKRLDEERLANEEVKFDCPELSMERNYDALPEAEARRLLAKHFMHGDATVPVSFTLLRGFIAYLATQLRGFSTNSQTSLDSLAFTHLDGADGIPLTVRHYLVRDMVALARHFITRSGASTAQDDNLRKAQLAHQAHKGGARSAEDVVKLMKARDIDENLEQALVWFHDGVLVPFYRKLSAVPDGVRKFYNVYAQQCNNPSLNLKDLAELHSGQLEVRRGRG